MIFNELSLTHVSESHFTKPQPSQGYVQGQDYRRHAHVQSHPNKNLTFAISDLFEALLITEF